MENAYLQESFKSEKTQYYQRKLFDDTKILKKWLCLLMLIMVVWESVQSFFIAPKRVVDISMAVIIVKVSGYVLGFTLYYISIFKFFEKKDKKMFYIRFFLVLMAMLFICLSEALDTYYRLIDRVESNSTEKWFYGLMRSRNEVWMILLIDNLIPIWYLRLILPAAYWISYILVYYNQNVDNKFSLWSCCITSFSYLVIILAMKAYSDWKSFISRLNIENWDGVHRFILDRIPDSIAIVDSKLNILYSNTNFETLCNNDINSLSSRLVNIRKQSVPLLSKYTENFYEHKWEDISFDNDDDPSSRNKYTSTRNIEKDGPNSPTNLSLTKLLESVMDPQNKRKPNNASNYHVYHAEQPHSSEEDSPVILYEVKMSPLFGFGKAILILTDITHHNLALSLEAANRYKDQLLATVSHDLRAPINGGVALIESTIEHQSVPEFIKEQYLIPAQRSCKFLLHLVNDILDFSQINAKKLRMCYEEQSLAETLRECYKLIEIQTKEKGIEFSLEIGEDLPEKFTTDHKRLSQIIINLLTNAIKFTSTGEVKLIAEADGDSAVKIKVSDTGIGIKQEDLAKLFKNFTRISSGDKGLNNRGVGLGLAIANKLARILGSQAKRRGIQVSSIYGKGTDFWFHIENMKNGVPKSEIINYSQSFNIKSPQYFELNSFPEREEDFAKQHIDEIDNLSLKLSPRSPYLSSCPSQRQSFKLLSPSNSSTCSPLMMTAARKSNVAKILVVDDDPLNILALRSILKQSKHNIEIAFNGKEAIQKVLQLKNKSKDFDMSSLADQIETVRYQDQYKLILMDYEMPIMTGIEATQVLTTLMKNREIEHIPIVGCSAHNETEKIKEGLRNGMCEVIEKPIQREKLMKLLEKYVDTKDKGKLSIFSTAYRIGEK